jgi:hypothetical protein
MIASENPKGSDELKAEQIWTQVREAKKHHQSLYRRITAGNGYGEEGRDKRPVATTQPAETKDRELARLVLDGGWPSKMSGAMKFFEPAEQDKAYAVAERARVKKVAGKPLTKNEKRLVDLYKKNADGVRADWSHDGDHVVATIDGVEFWT